MANKTYKISYLSEKFYENFNENLYVGCNAKIDKKEFIELENKVHFIVKKFSKYVNNYIRYKKSDNKKMLDEKYKFSSLQYFDKELGV